MVRIVLVDDHTGVREGAALVLEQEPEFEVVGQADSPRRPATCPSPGHRRVCRACQLRRSLSRADSCLSTFWSRMAAASPLWALARSRPAATRSPTLVEQI